VILFAPSTLDWPEQGVKLTQTTRFPEQTTTSLRLSLRQPARLTIHQRVPGWARNATAAVNGKPEAGTAQPGSYLALTRTWTSGDTITLGLPMSPRHEATPDNPKRVAFFYGPVPLAGLPGTENMPARGPYGRAAPDEWITAAAGAAEAAQHHARAGGGQTADLQLAGINLRAHPGVSPATLQRVLGSGVGAAMRCCGRGGAGRKQSQRNASCRPGRRETAASTTLRIAAASPVQRRFKRRSWSSDGPASSKPSTTGSSPLAQTAALR
jgi:hypothetical protein